MEKERKQEVLGLSVYDADNVIMFPRHVRSRARRARSVESPRQTLNAHLASRALTISRRENTVVRWQCGNREKGLDTFPVLLKP